MTYERCSLCSCLDAVGPLLSIRAYAKSPTWPSLAVKSSMPVILVWDSDSTCFKRFTVIEIGPTHNGFLEKRNIDNPLLRLWFLKRGP